MHILSSYTDSSVKEKLRLQHIWIDRQTDGQDDSYKTLKTLFAGV